MNKYDAPERDDGAHFNKLYQSNYAMLYLHAFKMLGDGDLAKDVVQDIFTHLWSKRDQLTKLTNPRSYLVQAVKNKILDIYAHQVVVRKFQHTIPSDFYIDHQERDDADLLLAQVEKEISLLPEQMRKIFEMSHLQEKSNAQIAEELHISINTVKTHIGRALKKIRFKFTHLFF